MADRDKPAAGSVRAREISPALRALLMAKKPLTYDAGPTRDLAGTMCGFRPCVAGQKSLSVHQFFVSANTAVCTCCLATVVSKRLLYSYVVFT